MKQNTSGLNRTVLNRLAATAPEKKPAAPRYGRKSPVVSFTGSLSKAIGRVFVGDRVSLRIEGIVRSAPQPHQKSETSIAIHRVHK